jgi:hypothetical protein
VTQSNRNGSEENHVDASMAPPSPPERLTWPERLKVISVSLGFLVVLGFLTWLFWTHFNFVRNPDLIWKDFWEPVARHSKLPQGIAALVSVAFYLIVPPLGFFVFLCGVFQGVRGKRNRASDWILRQMNAPAQEGDLPPAVGWAVFLGLLAVGIGVLVWAATTE